MRTCGSGCGNPGIGRHECQYLHGTAAPLPGLAVSILLLFFNKLKKILEFARSVVRHDAAIPALVGTGANICTGSSRRSAPRDFDNILILKHKIAIANPRERVWQSQDRSAQVPISARDCFTSFAVSILFYFSNIYRTCEEGDSPTRQSPPWSAQAPRITGSRF